MKREKKYGKPPCLFKAEVSADEFRLLVKFFEGRGDWFQATYIYFDTDMCCQKAKLYQRRLRLRVRIKDGLYSLELKDYNNLRHREIAQRIGEEDFRNLLQGVLPTGEIKRRISLLSLEVPFRCVNLANTIRKKIHFEGGILVLDQTNWHGEECHEVEFRSENPILSTTMRYIRRHFCLSGRTRRFKIDGIWAVELVVA